MSGESENESLDRMSRKEFCRRALMRILPSTWESLVRLFSYLMQEIAITGVMLIVIALCAFVPSLWIIAVATLLVLMLILLVHRYEVFKAAVVGLPIVRRMHDFGLSVRVGFITPVVLFLLSLMWTASYESNEIEAVYERCGVSEVDKQYYARFGERDKKWADAEFAVLEKVSSYRANALYGFGAWYVVLLLACLVVPGSRKENRYGPPPKQ